MLRYVELEGIVSVCLQEPVRARKLLLQSPAQPGAIPLLDGVTVTCDVCVAKRQLACVEENGVAGLEVMRLSGLASGFAIAYCETLRASVICCSILLILVVKLAEMATLPVCEMPPP